MAELRIVPKPPTERTHHPHVLRMRALVLKCHPPETTTLQNFVAWNGLWDQVAGRDAMVPIDPTQHAEDLIALADHWEQNGFRLGDLERIEEGAY